MAEVVLSQQHGEGGGIVTPPKCNQLKGNGAWTRT